MRRSGSRQPNLTQVRMLLRSVTALTLLALLPCPLQAAPPLPEAAGEHVICSVEEYVLTGLEFEMCQEHTLKNYSTGRNPCPILQEVIEVCAENVKPCFTDAGFKRGKQIFYDQLALQYPEVNKCNIFTPDKVRTERLPGELCTIAEEVVNGQEIARCKNNMIGTIVTQFRQKFGKKKTSSSSADLAPPPFDGGEEQVQEVTTELSPEAKDRQRRKEFCSSLLQVKEDCIDAKLRDCYKGRDFEAHAAYMVEALKISASSIALHLNNLTDVADCPVFDPLRIHPDELDDGVVRTGGSSSGVGGFEIAIIAIVLLLLGMGLLLAFIAYKANMCKRVQAWVSKVPYEDMITDSSVGSPTNDLDTVMQNHVNANKGFTQESQT